MASSCNKSSLGILCYSVKILNLSVDGYWPQLQWFQALRECRMDSKWWVDSQSYHGHLISWITLYNLHKHFVFTHTVDMPVSLLALPLCVCTCLPLLKNDIILQLDASGQHRIWMLYIMWLYSHCYIWYIIVLLQLYVHNIQCCHGCLMLSLMSGSKHTYAQMGLVTSY